MLRCAVLVAWCTIVATQPTWPPGGTVSSGITAGANNRYLPSTQRYNLVWTDQIITSGLSTGQIQFAAQNYVGTQKVFLSQATQFRVYNNNFLVLGYHLTVGLNPQKNQDVPQPTNPCSPPTGNIGVVTPPNFYRSEWDNDWTSWLASKSITMGSARYENMFQHYDSVAAGNRIWHYDPQWVMNINNTDWVQYMCDTTVAWMQGLQNEGMFFDVAVEIFGPPLYYPTNGQPSGWSGYWFGFTAHRPAQLTGPLGDLASFAAWQNQNFLRYFKSIHAAFSASKFLVIPNVDKMITSWYDPTWTEGDAGGQTIDGAMMEDFGAATGSDMYLTLKRAVGHLTSKGKTLIAQFYQNSHPEILRRMGMYMLVKNTHSYVANVEGSAVSWWPEYEIDIGDQSTVPAQLDDLLVMGSPPSAVFIRNYSAGLVACNTASSSQSIVLAAGITWTVAASASGGGDVPASGQRPSGTVTWNTASGSTPIPAENCLIFAKPPPAGSPTVGSPTAGSPTPASPTSAPTGCNNNTALALALETPTNCNCSIYISTSSSTKNACIQDLCAYWKTSCESVATALLACTQGGGSNVPNLPEFAAQVTKCRTPTSGSASWHPVVGLLPVVGLFAA